MCDTLVALGNSTKDNSVIFGKNSDRANNEAQLITFMPSSKHSIKEDVNCTYITIPQVSETHSVILSKPFWMYGAEMAANEFGVVIGNEAVHTKEEIQETGLLGMDLLRLGVERAKTAREALDIIIELLETHGQGGDCSFEGIGYLYHNSFIIADSKEGFVLETADKWWVVETVKDVRSISNNLSIRGKGDMRRKGIIQHAIEKGYCKDDAEFDFALIFSHPQIPDKFPSQTRDGCTMKQLKENQGDITPAAMMEFLREHNIGICMHYSNQSVGSQVSHLQKGEGKYIHWFTGGTMPCLNIFKPYVFPAEDFRFSADNSDPYTEISPDWFWSHHKKFTRSHKKLPVKLPTQQYIKKLREIENDLIFDVENLLSKDRQLSHKELAEGVKILNYKAWEKSEEVIK
ncbi:MAG: C69 family dipeptidase [Promethearchaeota archaeon]|jgi:secernin